MYSVARPICCLSREGHSMLTHCCGHEPWMVKGSRCVLRLVVDPGTSVARASRLQNQYIYIFIYIYIHIKTTKLNW